MSQSAAGESASDQVEMWEAKAAPGAGAALLAWVWEQLSIGALDKKCQVFGAGDRVVVIVPDASSGGLPDPPAALIARPTHRWRFDRLVPPAKP